MDDLLVIMHVTQASSEHFGHSVLAVLLLTTILNISQHFMPPYNHTLLLYFGENSLLEIVVLKLLVVKYFHLLKYLPKVFNNKLF